MRPVPHSAKVETFEGFEFDLERVGSIISEAVNAAIEKHLAEHPPRLSLPFRWHTTDGSGGKAVDDPLTLYVRLPFDEKRDGECIWIFTLGELVDDELFDGDFNKGWNDADWDGMRDRQLAMAKALRELADKIERAARTESDRT